MNQHSNSVVVSPEAGDFKEVAIPWAPMPARTGICACQPGHLEALLRSRMETRWSLSRLVVSGRPRGDTVTELLSFDPDSHRLWIVMWL
ncbi:hypothetical protein PF005_g18572 [Phytophthora fragariae]|uniref:Uncharacterized protein n=1 Tax=Phytophthora fragariae TaxID=53985 RepID=A0A6A3X3W9_9STRA|nr:hypothetical protein PF003_g17186 [Phytophthora fragariae]KAE8947131.1 hypothetical protein PF009_g3237 [Phytophthora fragariae]KAE9089983.1 hypothetical protein PF010_g18772 [Phytophthora fragariae]KAE9187397.1 hypothetical protein PF004_g22807 [Phytophthora fragariae]KAE9192150.1 hypothetical protein PF005_g18572 [Phytophthora fragariae]